MREPLMMTKHPAIHLAALAVSLTPLVAFGNGLRLPSQDAFATARGEAFVATADNPSAIYYNPAGLTQSTNTQIRSGIYGLYYDPTYQPPKGAPNEGKTYGIKEKFAASPQFFFSSKLKDLPVTAGLGIYAPYGGAMKWPSDTGFRTIGTQSAVTYIRFNPAAAIKLGEKISLGAGVMVDYAKINFDQGLVPQPGQNYFHFTGDGWSVGYNVGVLWQPIEQLSFGATFRSQTSFTMNGNTSMERQPFLAHTTLPATMNMTFPLTAVFGVSYRPTPKWNLEADADYTDWSSFGTTSMRQSSAPPFPVHQNIPVHFGWEASWLFELGATRYFDNGWHASAGYTFDQNSVPNAYYTPLVADLDRHFVSFGAGHTGKLFDFDLTYQIGYGPNHTVAGSYPSSTPGRASGQSADGTYAFFSQAIMVTMGIHF